MKKTWFISHREQTTNAETRNHKYLHNEHETNAQKNTQLIQFLARVCACGPAALSVRICPAARLYLNCSLGDSARSVPHYIRNPFGVSGRTMFMFTSIFSYLRRRVKGVPAEHHVCTCEYRFAGYTYTFAAVPLHNGAHACGKCVTRRLVHRIRVWRRHGVVGCAIKRAKRGECINTHTHTNIHIHAYARTQRRAHVR